MRVLKINAAQQAAIQVANRETRNVIVVPFSIEGREGAFVEYDHLDSVVATDRLAVEDHTLFQKHRERILAEGPIDTKEVILASEIPDRIARVVVPVGEELEGK